jgi:hypothetical protein
MDIGPVRRIIRVEPVEDPFAPPPPEPERQPPAPDPEPEREPEEEPART